jgi:hypothetical protein
MASGFGCLVIGPAGSGKVSFNNESLISCIVYFVSRFVRKWRPLKEKLQGD